MQFSKFLAQCSCSSNFPNDATGIFYDNGTVKCYALFNNALPNFYSWADAQDFCVKNVGSGNAGRLATFASCDQYTAVKTGLAVNNSYDMWIGMQNASDAPAWVDPNGVCSQESFNINQFGFSCNGSAWNVTTGMSCVKIFNFWGAWQGANCSIAKGSFLCEFGNCSQSIYTEFS